MATRIKKHITSLLIWNLTVAGMKSDPIDSILWKLRVAIVPGLVIPNTHYLTTNEEHREQ